MKKRSLKPFFALFAMLSLLSLACVVSPVSAGSAYSVTVATLQSALVDHDWGATYTNYTASVYIGSLVDNYTGGTTPYIAVDFLDESNDGFGVWFNHTYVGKWDMSITDIASGAPVDNIVHNEANITSNLIVFANNGSAWDVYVGTTKVHTTASYVYYPVTHSYIACEGNDTAVGGSVRVSIDRYSATAIGFISVGISLESIFPVVVTMGVFSVVMGVMGKFGKGFGNR